MTTGAFIFMIVSWAAVLGLVGWSFYRVLDVQSRRRGPPPE
jgi:hypothetical protein